MKLQPFLVFLFTLALILVSFTLKNSSQPVYAAYERLPVGRVIETKGEVLIKRQNWSDYHPLFVGTELYANDQIKSQSQSKLTAICYENWETWNAPTDQISQPNEGCLQARTECVKTPEGCVPVDSTRSNHQILISDRVPYIISPRHTLLLNNKPIILRWNPVVGASRYTVMIKSPSESIWETEVSSNQVIYEAYTSLKPGVRYIAIVHADINVSSLDEESPFSQQDGLGMGFSILDELTQQEITTKTEQLTQKLSGEAKTLALVELYQKNKLNDEAIEQLESLIKENQKNAAIYHKLGELYQEIQLPLLAKESYLKAVELIADEDIAGMAEVQAALGQIYRTLGQKKEAVYWLTLAYNQYQQLGEQQRQTEIKQLVEQISQSTL
ncbi:hypothetical protein [Limnoraphis robusta]|uniref:Tetratricopeptide repeat protein n=1 Tax=Limnoraphis robusta CCNP1315 TaxID=3110306 RepID=A0ABU5TTS6_9CYAN|nr:hypothetical protein [Limnoraphis robusta]MEA5518290.1 hypothetical protein [Limnoraphis robusta CCNP1315]MEA5545650.1 hypothetical protein [Limnoraphis robusta CCNP1324]